MSSEEGQPPRKRYAKGDRSARACDACHSRKTRCSGAPFPCTFCSSRSIECIVSDPPARRREKPPSQSQDAASSSASVAPLSAGLDQKPVASTSYQAADNVMQMQRNSFSGPQLQQAPHPYFLADRSHQAIPNIPFSPPQNPYSAPLPLQSPSILTGAAQLPTSTTSAYLPLHPSPGQASVVSLPSTATPVADGGLSVSGAVMARYQRPPATILKEPRIPDLISRRESTRFLEAYFSDAEFIYQLWPNPEEISRTHEQIWDNDGTASQSSDIPQGQRTTLAALLALGAFLERQIDASERLYAAARASFLDVVELASIESVQLSLQMAMFEINTSRSNALWATLAVSVRLCLMLNLHRRPALAGRSKSEALKRCQLFYATLNHDVWLSLTSGRPSLLVASDCDLPQPWEPTFSEDGHTPLQIISNQVYAMRVRCSLVWLNIHSRLYSHDPNSGVFNTRWLAALPHLNEEFQKWENDIKEVAASVSSDRNLKRQSQAVKCAAATMKLIMHRSFLVQKNITGPEDEYRRQRGISEEQALDGALTIIQCIKQLVALGINLSYWFLCSSLQIACLALVESQSNSEDTSRHKHGLAEATSLLEELSKSGESAAAQQVLHAVQSIQDASSLFTEKLPSRDPSVHQAALSENASLDSHLTPVDPTYNSLALNNDLDWLNFSSSNMLDDFIGSAPASESLAWWLNPMT